MPKQPRIFAVSSGQHINIGDVCFTPALLTLCQRHCPGIQVAVSGALQGNPELLATTRRQFPWAELLEGHLYCWDRGGMTPEVERAFSASTLAIHGSGPFVHFGQHRPRDWEYTMGSGLLWWLAADRGIPFGILGQSFEGFAYPSDAIFRRLLPQAAFVFARETDSLALLRRERLGPVLSAFVPDCAWAFEGRDEAGADRFLAEVGLAGQAFVIMGCHTRTRAEDLPKFAEAIERVALATGLPVLLGGEDHRAVPFMREHIVPLLGAGARSRIRVPERFWTADSAASVCARAASVAAGECHLGIIAAGTGTPFVHLRNYGDNDPWSLGDPAGSAWPGEGKQRSDGRKAQIFTDLGLGDWCVASRASGADQAAPVIAQVANPAAARTRVAAAVKVAHARLAWAMGIVDACAR